MKKLVSISLIMVWALSLCTGVLAETVTSIDVKKAFNDELFSSQPQYDYLLDKKSEDGITLRSIVDKDMIYKLYDIRSETENVEFLNYEFLNYKQGDDFTKYFDNYFNWIFPVTKDDGTIQEYSCVIEKDGDPSISKFNQVTDINKGYGIYLNHERMAQIISDANIGVPSKIIAGQTNSPVSSVFIYVKTNSGQYVIPFSSKLQFYNKYHDDKIELTNYKAYTTDEYVGIVQKERQGWGEFTKKSIEDNGSKNLSNNSTYKDENGDLVTPSPSSTPSVTPSPTPSTTPNITPSSSPSPTPTPTLTPKPSPEITQTPSQIIGNEISVEEMATILHDLGLFKGTENGYDLDSTFTRAQGATMLVRLMGKEGEALLSSASSGFTDVPNGSHWASPYIGYCARNGMIKGTSETTFTPDREMTAQEFLTIIIRVTGNSDVTPETSLEIARQLKLVSADNIVKLKAKDNFSRGDMVEVSYNYYTEYLIDN